MDAEGPQELEVEGFVTLHVPSRYSYLRIVRQSVLDICARSGASQIDAAQLEMAVDEACANIIEHSYGGENAPSDHSCENMGLKINLLQHRDRIVVEIYDFGKGFNFESYAFPEPEGYLENKQTRGLGMFIINQFVNEVLYERGTSRGNYLRLTRMLS